MIPRKIELKNFLSYGSEIQTIDFKDHKLICFSGKNGNGKSALLDALTWGIWGCGRKISTAAKADSGLIRLGQTQMMVCVEFEFNSNIYRIRREFAKTYGRDYQALDLEIFDNEKNAFSSLSDKTIKKTQEKIETLLGLDFETFANSAFLRQGLANEFSQKNPRERKQILCNILGLNKYENLKNIAQEKARNFTVEKEKIQTLIDQLKSEMIHEEKLKEELSNQQLLLSKNNLESQATKNEIISLNKKILELQSKEHELKTLQNKLIENKQLSENKKTKYFELATVWRDIHKKNLHCENTAELEKQKNELSKIEKQLRGQQQEDLKLQEEIFKNQMLYQQKLDLIKKKCEKEFYEEKLTLDRSNLEFKNITFITSEKLGQKKDLELKIELARNELLEVEKELKKQDDFKIKFEKTVKDFDKRRTFYNVWIQKGNWVKESLVQLERKKHVMHDEKNPSCPLCDQLLTASRKKYLISTLAEEELFKKRRLKKFSFLISTLKDLLFAQNEEIQKLKAQEDHFKKLNSLQEQYLKQILEQQTTLNIISSEIEKLEKNKQEIKTNISNISIRVAQKEKELQNIDKNEIELQEITNLIVQLQNQKTALNFDYQNYLKVSEQLEKIENSLKAVDELKKETQSQKERRIKLTEIYQELKELNKLSQSLEKQILEFGNIFEAKIKLEKELQFSNENLLLFDNEKNKILQEIGSLENSIKRISNLKNENVEKESRLNFVFQEINDYQKLASYLGKDGIQAILIEESIPEIEEEANLILSKLSDNQAQIFIESLRDLKKGGVKETLDIKISDATGIRPYEMFSGGEAFRIDFALRIAISKMLARRAGTALQTLIIDEGFGSQDEEGLNRLMESIYSIQDDFSKIIVVSHLNSFKDNFPVHFVVEKTPSGSVVNVVERG
ncbi:TPA: hypothetical protein DEO28_02050 [Candidatus Dependentiae bacterium]|nr:MAG: SMC domain protein [candidate division TM6 bacterium GW2011_GWE2_31_21]KKP53012.1 MAG: SMC domain protein [candidate division TM6 bacterium GW2011_GWF2_33_332]HBS47751.1 hypothetical protein [Candidatus Dependentiae bacterium]HBZ73273.1 hypothetical protein [Candidatus Dependentiae bacterium]